MKTTKKGDSKTDGIAAVGRLRNFATGSEAGLPPVSQAPGHAFGNTMNRGLPRNFNPCCLCRQATGKDGMRGDFFLGENY